jgi:hypothetical protein
MRRKGDNMSKSDKHMGIPKPKYDPRMKKPKILKASKSKPWMLTIPEREPTDKELKDAEYARQNMSWYPDWLLPWKEKRIDKYSSLKSAKQALATHRKKSKSDTGGWKSYPYCHWELDRAIITNTTTGEVHA